MRKWLTLGLADDSSDLKHIISLHLSWGFPSNKIDITAQDIHKEIDRIYEIIKIVGNHC